VAVQQPGYIQHFTKLADATYNAPPGVGANLALASGAYTYTAKDRTTLAFDTAGNLATWSSPGNDQPHLQGIAGEAGVDNEQPRAQFCPELFRRSAHTSFG
jgi:hypothetical protein